MAMPNDSTGAGPSQLNPLTRAAQVNASNQTPQAPHGHDLLTPTQPTAVPNRTARKGSSDRLTDVSTCRRGPPSGHKGGPRRVRPGVLS
jgi:hypothetical protein